MPFPNNPSSSSRWIGAGPAIGPGRRDGAGVLRKQLLVATEYHDLCLIDGVALQGMLLSLLEYGALSWAARRDGASGGEGGSAAGLGGAGRIARGVGVPREGGRTDGQTTG